MEQLSIRDWMIIIGGMMIAGVLIDAVRRYWRESDDRDRAGLFDFPTESGTFLHAR